MGFHRIDLTINGELEQVDIPANMTLMDMLREQLVFPEIDYDSIDKIRGMEITIVTTAQTDEEGYLLLRHLGMPFAGR